MQRIHITVDIETELASLYEKHGRIDEAIVVSASKRKRSSMHALFHWDDDKEAAHLGRLEIARQLIKSIKITNVKIPDQDGEITVRAYHGIGTGYASLHDVIGKEELNAIVLANALKDLRAFKAKYAHLKALTGLIKEIDRAIESNVTA